MSGNGSGNGHKETADSVANLVKLTKKDFTSDQEVRWCPGCGDYSILAMVQKVMPDIGVPKENIVFVSGIGCSSRFPYYMNTYGFHSIHGRAPAIATGIKAANPELSVWVVTGDGDGLSIGGNHLLHALRRNIDLKIILFNNRIYGLTKGQYSPTSEFGKKTKSTPMGSIDYPLHPLCVAYAAEASFIARSMDRDTQHLAQIVEAAAHHEGSAFVEVFQNCNIFNDGAFEHFTERDVRDEHTIKLEHGKPLVFGKQRNKGIRMNGTKLEVVQLGDAFTEADLIVHDAHDELSSIGYLLARMDYPEFPVPLGVFKSVRKPTYETLMEEQIHVAVKKQGAGDLSKLLNSGDTWVIN